MYVAYFWFCNENVLKDDSIEKHSILQQIHIPLTILQYVCCNI